MIHLNVIGRLGVDAEIKTTKKGSQFVTFRVATDVFVDGENQTVWFNVRDFSERGLKMVEFLKKGRLVHVHGLETVSLYTDSKGETKISRDITAYNIDLPRTGASGATTTEATTVAATPQTPTTTTTVTTPVSAPVSDFSMEAATCGTFQPTVVTASAADIDDLPF
jgi:single-strand DNA-binding protein